MKSMDVTAYMKRNMKEKEKHLVRRVKTSKKAGMKDVDIIKLLVEERDEVEIFPSLQRTFNIKIGKI